MTQQIVSVKRADSKVFSVGDDVKVIGEAVKGWDRNPPHKISYFTTEENGDVWACLKTKIPVCGNDMNTTAFTSGVFPLTDFEHLN